MFWNRKKRKAPKALPPFVFMYRGVQVICNPEDIAIAIKNEINVYVDGKPIVFDREESMRFLREYLNWLDEN